MTKSIDENIWQFPCDFPIKMMGLSTPEFEAAVKEIIARHVPDLQESAISFRKSADGKYISITVVVQATSKAQLDAIYYDLTACELVLMAL